MSYVITVAIFISIYAIVAYGLNIIVGYAGQISLGHAAFFGIGAYSAALLTTKAGLTFWGALPIVILISAIIGILCGLPSLRVKNDFLAITTIGINFIVEAIFLYIPFFGGALGLGGIPRVVFWGTKLKGGNYLALCLCVLLLVVLINRWFAKRWMGLACIALREDETAASSMGISPMRFKLIAFVMGTAIAGVGGALYAHQMHFIAPSDFGFTVSVMLLSFVVLGGMGTLWGPLLGALILGSLPELARPLANYRMLLYSALLLLMIRFQPQGLLGKNSFLLSIFSRKERGNG
ncbi:MAG: branched-chain amino acid ABC transporter permease [Aminobacterium sp.]|jgi:branched-chain amino acid transport system permease protein|nr:MULTISPECIES: branched-chain amino acid ABC transporter permease [unclassified Aminobacterium]MDD2207268.1 branched-chain amino acid ABC transporter permease [Aminobacterium sp.]MDD3425266.1 branched-chain amino acid ABC transporter permease [Aminobacterium sp.]MDD3707769.1 branched-chain amino acid ABC transporter permease [Aminobacterium sp.]MDD4229162.1 branched-chain amino acid ABC transporter permease [Aminobacterium sp.]MDD4552027.1 branched-chain amino acid ABC transporter permease [